MTWREILKELRSNPTVSVPTAGHALAGLSPKAPWRSAARSVSRFCQSVGRSASPQWPS
jgi:hypothetical protein